MGRPSHSRGRRPPIGLSRRRITLSARRRGSSTQAQTARRTFSRAIGSLQASGFSPHRVARGFRPSPRGGRSACPNQKPETRDQKPATAVLRLIAQLKPHDRVERRPAGRGWQPGDPAPRFAHRLIHHAVPRSLQHRKIGDRAVWQNLQFHRHHQVRPGRDLATWLIPSGVEPGFDDLGVPRNIPGPVALSLTRSRPGARARWPSTGTGTVHPLRPGRFFCVTVPRGPSRFGRR